jgi:hypothetical protein
MIWVALEEEVWFSGWFEVLEESNGWMKAV